jgi:hypothetical protein
MQISASSDPLPEGKKYQLLSPASIKFSVLSLHVVVPGKVLTHPHKIMANTASQ